MVMPRSRSKSIESSKLRLHVPHLNGASQLQDAVGQRRLAVVDVGDDAKVASMG